MSGTKRVGRNVTPRSSSDPDFARWVAQEMVQTLRAVVRLANKLSGEVVTYTSDATLPAAVGVALVDATAGPVTITIPGPYSNDPTIEHQEREVIIKKIDGTANQVHVVSAGSTIDGNPSIALNFQYERLRVVSSDSAAYLVD